MYARMFAVVTALGLAASQASANEGRKEQQRSQAPSQGEGKSRSSGGQARQEPMMQPGPGIKAHASDQIVQGRVASVSKDSVTIEGRGGQSKSLRLAPETVIDGKAGNRSALKEGQQVRASFTDVDGKSVAVEIKPGKDAAGGPAKQRQERGATGSHRAEDVTGSGAQQPTQQR